MHERFGFHVLCRHSVGNPVFHPNLRLWSYFDGLLYSYSAESAHGGLFFTSEYLSRRFPVLLHAAAALHIFLCLGASPGAPSNSVCSSGKHDNGFPPPGLLFRCVMVIPPIFPAQQRWLRRGHVRRFPIGQLVP